MFYKATNLIKITIEDFSKLALEQFFWGLTGKIPEEGELSCAHGLGLKRNLYLITVKTHFHLIISFTPRQQN